MSNGITAPFFLQHFTDPTSNKPISGGTVEYYVGGSTNIPKLVYADIALTNSLGNVLTLDAGGYAPQYYMLSGYYKIVLRRANGAIVYTRDYVEGGANSSNGDHKFAINQDDEDAGGAGFFQDKVVDSEDVKWETVDVGDGILKTKAKLNSGLVNPVWTILKITDPEAPNFGLAQLDLENIWTHHYGVAASLTQTTLSGSDCSIWYLEGGTYYGDATWIEKPFIDGQLILNSNKGTYDYLHVHPSDISVDDSLSNYPAGLYSLTREGDNHFWMPEVVNQYPDPSYNINSFLKYDATNKAFIWLDASLLTAKPIGPAGGDLYGFYPDPVVRQLTGVGANLTAANDDAFAYDPTTAYGAGRCIASGKAYYGSEKVERKCWTMLSKNANVYRTFNYWKDYKIENTVLKSKPNVTANEGSQLLGFVYGIVPGTSRWAWMWIAGDCNYHWYFSEHIPANYDNVGNTVVWSDAQTFGSVSKYRTPCHVSHYQGVYFLNDSFDHKNQLLCTKDWQTFELVTISSDEEITVPGNDGYGNLKLIERDTGIVHKCTYDANNPNWYKTWEVEDTIYLDKATTPVGNFPEPTNESIWYSSIQSMYGTWVISIAKDDSTNTEKPSFWYSEDGVRWNSVIDSSFPHFWEANTDGVRWFASNFEQSGSPIVYQLLLNQIPAHRQLVAEKGIIIDGDAFLTNIQNAQALGTDENGKIIPVSGGGGEDFIRNQASDGTNDTPGNIFADPYAVWKIRYEDTSNSANNVDWVSFSKDMLKIQGLDVNNPALIGYQAELTPSALALRGRPGTSYGIYNAAAIISREAFNWVPNVNGAWYEFNCQDLGGGTAMAQGGYRFPRLKFRISDTDTVSAELVHKIVDSNGAELSQVTNSTYGKALQIPTTLIAGTPNGQELFNYSAYELKTAIAQDGSGQGNNYGTRGFAFIALSSRLMTKGRMFVPRTGGAYMRFGIYDNAWKLIAKSPRTAVFGGIIPFNLTIGYGGVTVDGAQLIGGERYYMAYWCDDTTSNLQFGCITGRNTDSDNPQPQIFLDNQEMPDTMGTSGYRTAFRPWMAVYEA